MSAQRRNRRRIHRESQKHFARLGELLTRFYSFLEGSPKPSDEQVRNTFVQYEKEWKSYCRHYQLNNHTSELFNYEVGKTWRTRYAASAQN